MSGHFQRAAEDAERDREELAELTAERDEAHAEVRRLTAALAAHARHTDAAVDGVRPVLPAAMESARREGAEAMRAAIVERLKEEYRFHRGRERDSKLPMEDRSSAWERGSAVDATVVAVEELALPLDAPGGES